MRSSKVLVVCRNPNVANLFDEPGHELAVFCAMTPLQRAAFIATTNALCFTKLSEVQQWNPDYAVVVTEPPSVKNVRLGVLGAQLQKFDLPVVGASPLVLELEKGAEGSRSHIQVVLPDSSLRRLYLPFSESVGVFQSEAYNRALKDPEAEMLLHWVPGEGVITAPISQIAEDHAAYWELERRGILSRADGIIQHLPGKEPVCFFELTGIMGASFLLPPIVSWQCGRHKAVRFLPDNAPGEGRLLKSFENSLQAWKYTGPFTCQCCVGADGSLQVYRVYCGMREWVWAWLYMQRESDQSWVSMWRSISKARQFTPKVNLEEKAPWVTELSTGVQTTQHCPPDATAVGLVDTAYLFSRDPAVPQWFTRDPSQSPETLLNIFHPTLDVAGVYELLYVGQMLERLGAKEPLPLPEEEVPEDSTVLEVPPLEEPSKEEQEDTDSWQSLWGASAQIPPEVAT